MEKQTYYQRKKAERAKELADLRHKLHVLCMEPESEEAKRIAFTYQMHVKLSQQQDEVIMYGTAGSNATGLLSQINKS